ncbi:MAG: CBS domain-containing protein, partial [Mesorhizobium sp.]|nr:CBS domain-containing protein [Mesorhizobium sp.]
MTVKSILADKGRDVFTLSPTESIESAVHLLATHRIGALVITNGNGRIEGILSERDVVR